ncbi:MAG: hypothetical protein ACR2MK_03850 [Solirubrobacteraceae bacterium]
MWLAIGLFFVLLFMLIAGVLSGGIFTIVLVPAAILLGIALMFGGWGRAKGGRSTESRSKKASSPAPLPQSDHRNTAPAPATPDAIVDARQQQQ